jgi:hypothetical protein
MTPQALTTQYHGSMYITVQLPATIVIESSTPQISMDDLQPVLHVELTEWVLPHARESQNNMVARIMNKGELKL